METQRVHNTPGDTTPVTSICDTKLVTPLVDTTPITFIHATQITDALHTRSISAMCLKKCYLLKHMHKRLNRLRPIIWRRRFTFQHFFCFIRPKENVKL